jgi:transcriptional regulator with XRE-family HTH domain
MRIAEASTAETAPALVFLKKKATAELTFHDRLAAFRKERGLTQQGLAELVSMHISQIRRYESGQCQPTLGAIRKLSVALSVSADMLLFDKDERGPDEDLKLQFEAVNRLDPEEKKIIRSVIESIVLRNTMKEAERRFSDNGGSNR